MKIEIAQQIDLATILVLLSWEMIFFPLSVQMAKFNPEDEIS